MVAQDEPRRGRPRSDASRQAILKAALDLVGEAGFAALSIEGVAARAGVSKATIYRWWRTKVAVVAEAVDAIAGGAVPEPDTGSLDGDIRCALDDLLAAMRSPLGRVVEALAAASRFNPDLQAALEEHFLAHKREMVLRILGRAAARGEIRDDVDPALVADVVVAVLFYRAPVQPPEVDASVVEGFITILSKGVRKPA